MTAKFFFWDESKVVEKSIQGVDLNLSVVNDSDGDREKGRSA